MVIHLISNQICIGGNLVKCLGVNNIADEAERIERRKGHPLEIKTLVFVDFSEMVRVRDRLSLTQCLKAD